MTANMKTITGSMPIQVNYEDVLFDTEDAIINNEYTGFREDYLILHSLIRKHKPKDFFEIGTNMGTGTQIICNAGGASMYVFSLDLPTELAHVSLQHPISEGKGDNVGANCKLPYTQLRGDSLLFDFSKYKCEGYYCDGEHDLEHVFKETMLMLNCEPKIIIYHDTDIPEVMTGILGAWRANTNGGKYDLYRVKGTRVSYLLKK